jgi:hypothetical protein
MDKKVNILYTNGDEIYRVYWIKQNQKKDIYHGFVMKNPNNFKWSYHPDGKTHIKKPNVSTLHLPQRVPLKDIEALSQLKSFYAGDEEWIKKYYERYTGEKVGTQILIDTRLFPKKSSINIDLFLLNPKRADLLNSKRFNKENKDDYRILQIIKEIEPWLIVQARCIKN